MPTRQHDDSTVSDASAPAPEAFSDRGVASHSGHDVDAERFRLPDDGSGTEHGIHRFAPGPAIAHPSLADDKPKSIWQTLQTSWPVLISGIPALVTLVALAFSLFPRLEPNPPPTVRGVRVTNLSLGERNADLGDGRVTNAIDFAVEIAGYDADNISVDWLVLDAQTRERLKEPEQSGHWGTIDANTRTDRVAGEIYVPPPADHTGCIVVRVLLRPEQAPTPRAGQAQLLLDIADTAPFDPFDATNACPDNTDSPSSST